MERFSVTDTYMHRMDDTTDTIAAGDAHTMRRAKAGDRDAFAALVAPLLDSGYRVAIALLGNHAEAEDALQEATTRAWRYLRNVNEEQGLRSWYLAVVANCCRTAQRTSWFRRVATGALPWHAHAAEQRDLDAGADLRRALRALPHHQRLVVSLHYYADLPLDEVAAVAGVPVGTVKSRLHRALSQLKTSLADEVVATEAPA